MWIESLHGQGIAEVLRRYPDTRALEKGVLLCVACMKLQLFCVTQQLL